jgi:universal stress protein E
MATPALKSILVCIEYPQERRQPALRRAVQIARRSGARLTLFHSTFSQFSAGPRLQRGAREQDPAGTLDARKRLLQGMAAKLHRRGLKVAVKAVWDYPAFEAIVREVRRSKPDLVVAGSRRHVFGARLFLTNTDWQLIRLCPVPLLFVKQENDYGKVRVLAAIDPLHLRGKSARLDRRILAAAQSMARTLRGRLDVVHAHLPLYTYMPDIYGHAYAAPIDPEVEAQHRRTAQRALQRAVAALELPAGQVHLESGTPPEVVTALARRLRADIVVMGAVSRSALGRLLIGSTAELTLDHLPCDVLIVKPRGFKSEVPRGAARLEFPPPAF